MLLHASWLARVPASTAWLLLAVLLTAIALPALRAAHRYRSAVAAVVVLLAAARSLNATPDNGQLAGMSYHLLGMNLAVLVVGTPAALQPGVLLLFPSLLISDTGWQAYPFSALALFLPPLVVNLSFRAPVDRLSANIFVFIFLNGFIGSTAAMPLTGAVLIGVLDWTGAFSDGVMRGSVFPIFFLLFRAEVFIGGAVTAIFVALKPYWINASDDGRYLKSTNKIWQLQTTCHPANEMLMLYDMTTVALGAIFGALLRWLFGLTLADTVSWFALGMLATNWFGGFFIGVAAGLAGNPCQRLLSITGFLGSLTTFSGSSPEIAGMLQVQRWAAAAATASLHLFGSLLFTVLGTYLAQCFK